LVVYLDKTVVGRYIKIDRQTKLFLFKLLLPHFIQLNRTFPNDQLAFLCKIFSNCQKSLTSFLPKKSQIYKVYYCNIGYFFSYAYSVDIGVVQLAVDSAGKVSRLSMFKFYFYIFVFFSQKIHWQFLFSIIAHMHFINKIPLFNCTWKLSPLYNAAATIIYHCAINCEFIVER